ncbi:hypothetical protein NE303_02695 [Levilactobacillus brevis]|uniref:hypothetical protein n=1 Tax=Levilactobacillus brevis TaxID=1580 RepID=UPI00207436B3|nr:hypothetical protein [Levilactobacillus brevis]MCM6799359.1 hypothetical protein [Levilactobacillus brevis]MCM6801943.1 hypothetical protein [Levilactobacillus brevis]MCM6804971.1 hypothetical protein [Levilactobacillus brevis]MCM6807401.1 hypothetical protein [Levilactobacillus brevis]MCM6813283.1 hypothetical protein [Levilactobacillus brevis]
MPIYYVKSDTNNQFPDKDTTPVLEPADGLRAVNIPTTSVQYFTRYWWMYAFKGDSSQEVIAPGNLPNLDIDYLQGLINQEGETIQGLQTALGSATKAQVEAQQQFVTTQEQFQKQFGSLSQQIVAVQKQLATKAE